MGPICQAVISRILEFVRVNNKTGCALTDRQASVTYSESVIFPPDINVCASALYILRLVLAAIEETRRGHRQQEWNTN